MFIIRSTICRLPCNPATKMNLFTSLATVSIAIVDSCNSQSATFATAIAGYKSTKYKLGPVGALMGARSYI